MLACAGRVGSVLWGGCEVARRCGSGLETSAPGLASGGACVRSGLEVAASGAGNVGSDGTARHARSGRSVGHCAVLCCAALRAGLGGPTSAVGVERHGSGRGRRARAAGGQRRAGWGTGWEGVARGADSAAAYDRRLATDLRPHLATGFSTCSAHVVAAGAAGRRLCQLPSHSHAARMRAAPSRGSRGLRPSSVTASMSCI